MGGPGRSRKPYGNALALVLVAALVASLIVTGGGAAQAVPTDPLPSVTIPDAITFQDSFVDDRYPVPGWGAEPAVSAVQWTVSGGAVHATGPGRPAAESNFVAGDDGWSDYELSATITARGSGPVGLVFRHTSSTSFYRLELSPTSQALVKVVDGVATTLDTNPVGIAPGTHEVTTVVIAGDIAVSVDGDVTVQAIDPTPLPTGRIGFYSGSDGVTDFDDVRVLAQVRDGFTLAVLPDTQHYLIDGSNTFAAQTRWIAENRAAQKIVAVLHEGDVVDNWECPDQWSRAQAAMTTLRGRLPTVISSGNHDLIQYRQSCGGTALTQGQYRGPGRFDSALPIADFAGLGSAPEPSWGSFEGALDNSYQLVQAGGVDLLLLSLAFGPSNAMLAWADGVVRSHPDHLVVVVTHDYLSDDNQFRGGRPCPAGAPCEHALPGDSTVMPVHANTGIEIWNKLVKDNSNIRVVLSGHVVMCEIPYKVGADCQYTAGRRTDIRADGSRVHSMLANYQNDGGGYLRLLTINPATESISVRTVTPMPGKPALTDSKNQFVMDNSTPASGNFRDIPDSHFFASEINRAQAEGLIRGYDDATFRPMGNLSREAAAVILYRAQAKGDPNYREGRCDDPSAPGGVMHSPFIDVADSHPFCSAIAKMVESGMIKGFGREFRPTLPVERQAFVAFMDRTPATSSCRPFNDIDVRNVFCGSIKWAADKGITTGYTDGGFHPMEPVSRQAAAAMVMRYFDQL